MTNDVEQLELAEVLPASLTITAMRDSGYKNTAYALAELVDNSAQAKASVVEVFCSEVWQQLETRRRRRIDSLAVLDNGEGMSAEVLRQALQFGNGTRLADRTGIGRFGMGLPNSSVSQAARVDIWTWQHGPSNALHTYLDVQEIEEGRLREVPVPQLSAPPDSWLSRSGATGDTGTLVVWSKLDPHRLTWKTGKSTLEHTGREASRIYRKFLSDGRLSLRLLAFDDEGTVTFESYCKPNDPLYLMAGSTAPAPYDKRAMFQQWGEDNEVFRVEVDGVTHEVVVRISWAKNETVPEDGSDRGHKDYGKDAAKNLGVSIMRADREIDLDPSWANSYEPTERWWGVEVDFPPALDEIFGVTNNKQAATIFSQMAKFDWEVEADEGEEFLAFKERLRQEEDPRVHLIDITDYIGDQLKEVRKRLKAQTKGTRSGPRHTGPSVDDRASRKFEERFKSGHTAPGDEEEWTDESREGLIKDLTENKHYPERTAREIADAVTTLHRRTIFLDADSDSLAFFQVEQRPGGLTEIVFNTSHFVFEKLVTALDSDVRGCSERDLVDRIQNASDTLRLLFAAWARYELEDIPNRQRIRIARNEWGKMAQVFLDERSG